MAIACIVVNVCSHLFRITSYNVCYTKLLRETANPVAFLENTHNVDKQDRLTAMFFGTLTPIKGLTITSRGGTEMQFGMGHQWTEQYHFSSERSNQINNVTDNIYRAQRNLWENFASYNKSFNGHDLTGLVGMSYEDMFIP